MSEKKMNYNAKQSLSFQAETPDFLKVLQGAAASRSGKRDVPDFDDNGEPEPDAPELEDEKPQIVVEKGITELEVKQYLGNDASPSKDKGKRTVSEADEDEGVDSKKGSSSVKGGVVDSKRVDKRRKLDQKKQAISANLKKVNNKKLLSFDDES
ncbi:hypothetical protein BC832DRAFT_590420 [Gaertneriomyces semiglobifer]|nr:hypothetical protein BC832DRAFT_590420 [Gaertneriomyces semiglobifer]